MLRAIGMTRRQARRMIRQESVITALIGAALGLPLGVFLAALLTRGDVGLRVVLSIPWSMLAAFTAGGPPRRHRRGDPARPARLPAERPQRAALRVAMSATLAARPAAHAAGRREAGPPRAPGAPAPGRRARPRHAPPARPVAVRPRHHACSVCSPSSPPRPPGCSRSGHVTRATRLALGVTFGAARARLRRRLAWPARCQRRRRPARRHRHRLHPRRPAARGRRPDRPRRSPAPAAPHRRSACARPTGWVGSSAPVVFAQLGLHAARHGHPDHPRTALADRRVRARDPARGGPHRDLRTAASWPPGTCRRRTAPPCSSATARAAAGRGSCADIRMLARHGYGVLALDNPGNGESEGHSNGLGDNAQPGGRRRARLPGRAGRTSTRDRIAGVGSSLGGEVLLEATARDPRLRAVVSDGASAPAGQPRRQRRRRSYERVRRHARDCRPCAASRACGRRRRCSASMPRDRSATGAADRRRRRPGGDPDQPRRTATRAGANVELWSSRTPATPPACARTRASTSGG